LKLALANFLHKVNNLQLPSESTDLRKFDRVGNMELSTTNDPWPSGERPHKRVRLSSDHDISQQPSGVRYLFLQISKVLNMPETSEVDGLSETAS
jgi:hypothetical protein